MKTATAAKPITLPTANRLDHACKKFWRSRYLLLMLLPALIWYIVFMYAPMYGAQIAFRDFSPVLGITGSKWVGFKYFIQFFKSEYFGRLIKNTLGISLYSIIVGFPIPIILALLINEVRGKFFKRSVQTVVYLPHFISAVVVVSILSALLSPSSGLINQLITAFGGTPIHFMAEPKYFKTIYVLSDIWQSAGYGSIVYMAALTGIDPSLYEAATVDGASKWDKLIHITLPGLLPTIIIMLILRMGSIFSVGYEKIMLMYNPATYETADVISTYVYRRAFESGDYSFSAAVGLFNSVINFTIIVLFNNVSFWPKGFTTSMYEKVLKDASIWTGYLNTILYTVLGTLISVTLTACAAYPLSRKDLFGRNVFISLFIFTMFFNGGMIPTYLIIQKLGMLNKIWALVLPSAISTYNMIIMRTFFENTIPNELIEAAALDGCNDITTFFRIVLPLSGAVFAVMALFYGVAQWNSWFPALLYIRDRSLYPLQMILREVLIQSDIGNMAGSTGDVEVIGDGLKYATMVVSTLPIMCLYPFLQKYFVAGVTIGAVKG